MMVTVPDVRQTSMMIFKTESLILLQVDQGGKIPN
jgi:hypothetical protein